MKKLLVGFLGLGAVACQPGATHKSEVVAVKAPAAAVDLIPESARAKLPALFTPADTLTADMLAVLRAYDLSALWENAEAKQGLYPQPAFDGFFGEDRYRFAMIFNQVTRDPANPALFHVRGKSRYYKSKNIRPFTGTLTVRRLASLHYPGFLEQRSRQFDSSDSITGHTYTAHAQVQLKEDKQENSGLFEGEMLLDFFVVPAQPAGYVYVFDHEGNDDRLPTRGGGLLLRGNRLNLTTGQVKPFLVGPDLSAVAPFLFKDFMLDERMGQINPKYAKLGWQEYWDNTEWWADSPKPSLNF